MLARDFPFRWRGYEQQAARTKNIHIDGPTTHCFNEKPATSEITDVKFSLRRSRKMVMIGYGSRAVNRYDRWSLITSQFRSLLTNPQILRQDFIAKQRQWEIEQARTAPEAPPSFEEEHDDKTTPSQGKIFESLLDHQADSALLRN